METRQYKDWEERGELMNKVNELITAVALGNVGHVRQLAPAIGLLAEAGARFVAGEELSQGDEPAAGVDVPQGGAELPAVAQAEGDDDDDDEDDDDEEDDDELRERELRLGARMDAYLDAVHRSGA